MNLSDKTVRQARNLAARGISPAAIARATKLQPESLTAAIRGDTYKHITEPAPVLPTATYTEPPARQTVPYNRTAISLLRLDGNRLRAVRTDKLAMTQAQFTIAIWTACIDLGYRPQCDKRLVQKWEDGTYSPLPPYRHAIEVVTGETFESLCHITVTIPQTDLAAITQLISELIAEEEQTHQLTTRKLAQMRAIITGFQTNTTDEDDTQTPIQTEPFDPDTDPEPESA